MSIILDALKKAEKEREGQSSPDKAEAKPATTAKKQSSPALMIIATLMGLFGAGYLVYNHFIKNMMMATDTPSNIPAPKVVQAPKPEEEVKKISEEALNFFNAEDYKKSEAKWKEAVEKNPLNAESFNNLGLTQKKMGNSEGAYESYEKALSLKPDYPEALNNMAALYLEINQPDRAKELLTKALGLKNDYADAYFHRGIALEKSNEPKNAIADYKKFMELTPNIEPGLKGQIEMRLAVMEAKLNKK